ncbi:lipopolysaccharide biosynthesis protein [Arvimicrobium flavum]|uniref:lipopolysaccharide biosynthesis protein n=1 Tax=Arvimicrobium flavum TaxID=3393320 RepID=UPI00237A84E4|nr:oligosaccharide flippase family protein [Mesorhizobium shangrilense]
MLLVAPVRSFGRRLRQSWQAEEALRSRLVNVGHLLTGNLASSIVGMLSFVITARALGATDYGILALTYSYTRAVGWLFGSQSWQPLIKYGAELTGQEHHDDYRSLLKFGLVVDVLAAALSYVAAVGAALLFGDLAGIRGDTLNQVLIYSTALLFQINGLPTAILRLAGRFRLVAYSSVIGGVVRLVLCAAGLLAGWGLMFFVIAWAFSQIVGSIALLVLALIEARRQGVRRLLSAPLAGIRKRFDGLLRFTIGSNLELTIRSSANEFDTLLVGLLTDAAGAGFYHIAKRLGRLMLQIGVQVQAVVYPDAARLWAQGAVDEFRRTVFQTAVMLALFGAVMVVGTIVAVGPFLNLTIGAEFAAAAPLAIVQMIAVAITLTGSAHRTALLAMGKQPTVLKIVLVVTLLFHATAIATIPFIGAMGANVAHVVMAIAWSVALLQAYRAVLAEPADALGPAAEKLPAE